jgi:hypothetical protein
MALFWGWVINSFIGNPLGQQADLNNLFRFAISASGFFIIGIFIWRNI